MKDVTFEYLVNGEKLSPRQLTSTSINQVFGSSEFSVAGNYSKTEEINEVQVIIKTQDKIQSTISVKPCGPIPTETQRCIPKVPTDTKPSSTDIFMKRLWAFKRINYLLTGAKECIKLVAAYNIGNNDSCIQEALGLALEYNFVTDLTSLVIEETNDYIKEGPVQVNENPTFVYNSVDLPGPAPPPSTGLIIQRGRIQTATTTAPYAVALPDGRIQTVTYETKWINNETTHCGM